MYSLSNQFMRFLLATFSILFIVFIHFSCIPSDVKGIADTQFFDLKGFLDNQISTLENKEVTIIKNTNLQGKTSEQTFKKLSWKDEFAFFMLLI